jgi:hypothetical protein
MKAKAKLQLIKFPVALGQLVYHRTGIRGRLVALAAYEQGELRARMEYANANGEICEYWDECSAFATHK